MTHPLFLITGGNRGLGANMALHLARGGADILLTYRSGADQAAEVVTQIRALGRKAEALPLEVADSAAYPAFAEAVRAATRALGHDSLTGLINNAGHGIRTPFTETTPEALDGLYQVHVRAPYLLTQALLPQLADGGRLLFLSSGLARFATPGYSAYGAMKGAVDTLVRYLAQELGGRGISVNSIAPGAIETDFGGGVVRDNAEVNRMIAGATAMGRAGQPDDIGAAVASLLLSQGNWITGQRIEASGGQNL
ncbi:SDR family oxidoreductase [Pseudooceanicola sp. CBS1P-1]|uniref:SDR family oxidoreductase n=1 Tax=Pseudooceanicola albus TaxID=2692189 RepID=A0A6L7G7Q5_9RHOB|nr:MULTISPECIES: SDR family oxidoreductase [Pseudooceanicola]MBT9385880.1 SDR family oxidoreductase [Pseudooceanicola endophyticus]MXN20111.1 SDR family oxidoreductase [Pseudooceanicola albus]